MGTLKEALYDNLLGTLSDNANRRNQAEQQIKLLEVVNDYGIYLTELALDKNIDWPVRQLASVLLKQFVNAHWSKSKDRYSEPQLSSTDKSKIRDLLINALGEDSDANFVNNNSEKKLRSSLAYVVSAIAFSDWPEDWPNLFEILMNYLSSGNPGAIYSSMKVFNEICHDICDNQIPTIAPILLPKMYEIFVTPHAFSIGTRDRAIQIFTIISETIALMCDYDKTAIDNFLLPMLPQFTEALLKVLEMPDNAPEVDIRLKKTALNSITILIKNCRKQMWKYMPNILTPVWRIMANSAQVYVRNIVNSDSDDAVDPEQATDSDGEVLSIKSLILTVFEFVTVLIESPKTRKLIKSGIRDLIYYVLVYMQMTDDQMQIWISDPNQFVEEEDEESYTYSVRTSALDIILALAKEFEDMETKEENQNFQLAFIDAIKKHLEETNQAKQQGNSNWWKQQEACLFALGSLSLSLVDLIKEENNPLSNEYRNVLDHVFSCRDDVSVFYSGRSIWTAARYVPIMNPRVVSDFLSLTVNSLKHQNHVIQISAVRATFNFCVHLVDSKQEELLKPYLIRIFEAIFEIIEAYKSGTLSLVVETIYVLLGIDDSFTSNVAESVCELAIQTFIENVDDPTLIEKTSEIFNKLAKNQHSYKQTEDKLIPTITEILSPNQQGENLIVLKPVSLDILQSLVRNSPLPLSENLVNLCFPLACHNVLATFDDTAIMQEGGEAIRAYVSRSPEQMHRFRDPQSGHNGMSLVLKCCLHLLDPSVNEACASHVDKLIFVTINKGSKYLGDDNVQLLLRSVLSKLQTSKSLDVIQSLVMVFAHLLNHNLNTVLDFLSLIPAPNGPHSALEYVLTQWLSRQHLFYGAYETKVAIMALCKLLEHSINGSNNQNINLNRITVPGEPIISNENGIKTRSKTASKPDQWTTIPCSVKILKLLIHELNHQEFGDGCDDSDEDSEDDDQGNDSWSGGFSDENNFNASSYHQHTQEELEDGNESEDEDEDQDVIEDPISKVNLKNFLSNFLNQFMSQSCANEFASQLNENERQILKNVLSR